MQNQLIVPLLILALCLSLPGCLNTAEVNDRLVEGFDDLVFFVAPDRQGERITQRAPYLVRWEGEIRYFVKQDQDSKTPLDADIERAMEKIGSVAGRRVLRLMKGDAANIIFHLDARKGDYAVNGAERARCYASVGGMIESANDDEALGQLRRVDIHLPGKRLQTARQCLEHEILHAFGFLGHTQKLRSIMATFVEEDEMTKWDRVILKTLYHDTLWPGMKREAALKRARTIIRDQLAAD